MDLDHTSTGNTIWHTRGNNILDAHDMATSAKPVKSDIAKHVHEAHKRDDIRDAGASGIGNGALDRREHGAARDTHDEDTSATTGVAAQVGGSESEERGVHGGLKEEDGDQDTDGGVAGRGADDGVHGDGDDGVDHEEEVGLEDGCESRGDEAADGEGDERVGEHVRRLSGAESCVFGGVVDEEAVCLLVN